MTDLVFYLLVFLAVGVFFLFFHLMLGKLVRPARADAEKMTIYECGEPTIGSAWIQFDLRYYVVALLFVIFDVEVAFFFPWAVVFGHANALSHAAASSEVQVEAALDALGRVVGSKEPPLAQAEGAPAPATKAPVVVTPAQQSAASEFAWLALVDILVFFGVLLVGFAYLWKRGDIDWVRSVAAEATADSATATPVPPADVPLLAGSGQQTW
jgi:NADH-quinone oxidoreductase subunit A